MTTRKEWESTGNSVVCSDGAIFDIPVINPATGRVQYTSEETYALARRIAACLNDSVIDRARRSQP